MYSPLGSDPPGRMPSGLFFMRQALNLADRARGRTSPNPAVGAVIVKNGYILGKGFTQPAGGPHAEVVALCEAGQEARGAVLYVTLEPCSFWGRTPPCVDAIIAAGVAEVHIAIEDPNPRVAGAGLKKLQQSGIKVVAGESALESQKIIEGFTKYITTGQPFVTAKWAMTLDGKMAARTGDARWVTGEIAREKVHQFRDMADAIVVGVGTVIADDPLLTARPSNPTGRAARSTGLPLRVVVDSRGRIPLSSRLLSRELVSGTIIAVCELASQSAISDIASTGAEVAVLPEANGRVDLRALIAELARRGVVNIMLESGPTLLGGFLAAGLVDKVWAFVAPKLVGGNVAPATNWVDIAKMADALHVHSVNLEKIGEDIWIEGYLAGRNECSPVS